MYMARRTIQSPGVEINEIDLSLRAADKIGTNIFIAGFSPEGPTDEIIQVSTLSEFEQIYGTPTNPAERYFYHTVKSSFNSRANILVSRLPYGANAGDGFTDKYFATVYPVIPVNKRVADTLNPGDLSWATIQAATDINNRWQFSPLSANDTVIYTLGKPSFLALTREQYVGITDDSAISWSDAPAKMDTFTVDNNHSSINGQLSSLNGAGIIILNSAKTTINQKFEGYYTAISDNTNLYASTDYDDITRVQVSKNETDSAVFYDSLTEIPKSRLNFTLSANYNSESVPTNISQVQESIPNFEINTSSFDDTLVYGLYKLRSSVFSPDVLKMDFVVEEGYTGSIDYWRQINSQQGGAPISFFLPQKTQNESINTVVKINPNISGRFYGATLNDDGTPRRIVRVITDQLENNVYTGETPEAQFFSIVKLSSAMVSAINVGAFPYSDNLKYSCTNCFGLGNSPLLPGAKYSTPDRDDNNLNIGSITTKLDRVFDRLADIDLFDVDIMPEAGLATIATTVQYTTNETNKAQGYFDDRDSLSYINGLSATGPLLPDNTTSLRSEWLSIQNKFINFAENNRKDFIYISDPLRQIFVTGDNQKGINITGQTFPINILAPLRQLYSTIDTNYAAGYATWGRTKDNSLDGLVWVPFSGVAAGMYARTDANFAPWYAPAGFTRGKVSSQVEDIALYPNQSQRDQLYDQVNINPVAFFYGSGEGFVVMGQKTLQTKPSAFDRVNVRRLFLYLEKRTRQTVKYFVFEPNTLFTRTNVINVLTPIFEDAKNNEGVYDYLIVCDERNNTPEVIDANELVVDIYIKPVRAAEFILVNFYATRTGQNFSEIVG